ncbi:4710_t:CDS:2 [Paraglomus occultum]|uniref:4710_t:CDS:1 n=1 Tax=Paraglomus occultum TaxID=144539 RepID=A0A9N8VW51_9GLOM|nr:4710_t:CDS:2 [Paraglomus occultum]
MRTVFVIPLLLLILDLVSAASDWSITNPIGTTVWASGQDGKITWIILTNKDKGFNAAAPDVPQVNIDLMEGQFENANIAAHVATNVPVQDQTYTWANIPDYPQGNDYFIRIGTDKWWRYSHAFTFNGKGTVKPLGQPAPQPTYAPSPDAPGNSTTPGDNSPAGTTGGGGADPNTSNTSTTTSTTTNSAASATNKPSSNSNNASVAVTNTSVTLLTAMLAVICVAFSLY